MQYLFDLEGYPVFFHEEYSGFVYAAHEEGADIPYYIAVGPKYYELPSSSQKAALYHEIGHLMNGHLDIDVTENQQYLLRRRELALSGQVEQQEIQADHFAAEEVGYDVMIQTLRDLHNQSSDRGSRAELKTRIQILEDMFL